MDLHNNYGSGRQLSESTLGCSFLDCKEGDTFKFPVNLLGHSVCQLRCGGTFRPEEDTEDEVLVSPSLILVDWTVVAALFQLSSGLFTLLLGVLSSVFADSG